MKYIYSFNESNQDGKITDRDLELIENCFLDYIEQSHVGEFIPQSCKLYDFRHLAAYFNNNRGGKFPNGYVFLNFEIPQSTHASVQQSIEINELQEYLIWKWVYGFINQISGDVMRCESYGFKCYFVVNLYNIELIIQKKSAKMKEVSLLDLESVISEILGKMKSIEAEYKRRFKN